MTTAERREAILAQLGRKPIAARTLAAKVRRQPSGHRAGSGGAAGRAPECDLDRARLCAPAGGERLHPRVQGAPPPAQTGLELNLIVDCGGRVCSTSISHRVYGRITVELDIRSRQDVLGISAGV